LRRGDVIQQVNRQPVNNVAEFERAMKQAGDKSVLLLVNRNGHTSFVALAPQ
jgi:serine protease Do